MCVCVCVCVCVYTNICVVCFGIGVISADNEDETQRPEKASDGEVQRGGGPGLRWGGQVIDIHISEQHI